MKWDKKMMRFAVLALLLIVLAAGLVVWYSGLRIRTAPERIAGEAEEGFRLLSERVEKVENIFHVTINRRGRYEYQTQYSDFDVKWLRALSYVPGEFLDDVGYTHTITFSLKSYDTENVYSHRDAPTAYTRYDDEVRMRKNDNIYYVDFTTDGVEYHFMASCDPITEWLDGLKR